MTQRSFTARRLAVSTLKACALGALALLPGCMLEKQDDAGEYREALPRSEAVLVAGPEADASAPSATHTASEGSLRPLERTDFAKWYGFTRAVRGGVNAVTASVLGSVWLVVHSEPSALKDGEATWGPYTDSLEPVTYRFRVTRVAEAEYDYVLEGRPKASRSDEDYRSVLEGHGFGKLHEQHGEGEFTIDLSVARELDPVGHEPDSGTLHIAHQLPRGLGPGSLPRTIEAEVTPDPSVNRESYTVRSVANEDGTGSLHVVAQSDVDDSKATALENVTVDSRWRADGAGRADVVISGGDLPADPGEVAAVECWGADFARSFYADTVSFEPAEGEASACVYGAP
ncbi:MAG: hypothetical protein EOO73_09460 [Myxococcales bacterium]|nr:MAG: hypothetical protein EOO73_09460 [Myxococcales bacterium]